MVPCYSAIGRPSIDRELMVRMLLVSYLSGIRSEGCGSTSNVGSSAASLQIVILLHGSGAP